YVAEPFASLRCIDKGFRGICATLSGGNPPRYETNHISQFRLAPYRFTPGTGGARSNQRPGLGQGVAAVYPGDGGWTHRSCLEPARSVDVPCTAVAPAVDGLSNSTSG